MQGGNCGVMVHATGPDIWDNVRKDGRLVRQREQVGMEDTICGE